MTTKPLLVPSLYTFLSGLIDYAGLYPPAQLPLYEAIRNYVQYQRSEDGWMLGHFVIGANRLVELSAILAEHPYMVDAEPLSFAVVGQGGTTAGDFLAALEADAAAIQTFTAAHAPKVNVAQVEVKLPLLADAAAVTQLCRDSHALIGRPIFYEPNLSENWHEAINNAVAGIAACGAGAGLKLRTGGLTADAFPSAEQISHTLIACRDARVPLKFTAGLHHPIRQYRDEVQGKMYGFVNLFGAGLLAQKDHFSPAQMALVLTDEHADHFLFDPRGFRWQAYEIETEEIAAARQTALISFGSCSFDEPREDMRELGWL